VTHANDFNATDRQQDLSVATLREGISVDRISTLGPLGAGTLNHGGLRPRKGCTSSALAPTSVNTCWVPPGFDFDLSRSTGCAPLHCLTSDDNRRTASDDYHALWGGLGLLPGLENWRTTPSARSADRSSAL